jgi:hypothetical protein
MNFMCLTQCAETECSLDMCSAFYKRSYIIGVSSLSDEQGSTLRGVVAEELTQSGTKPKTICMTTLSHLEPAYNYYLCLRRTVIASSISFYSTSHQSVDERGYIRSYPHRSLARS